MNRRTFLSSALALPVLGQREPEEGFTPLFDGRTLAGWSVEEGPESAFYVKDGAIVVHEAGGFPAWLRSAREYENFDFRGEFFLKGWTDSGIFFHAPKHGRPTWNGIKVHLFHLMDRKPQPESMGAIFPLIPPLKVNVKNQGQWNSFRILMDWPRLRVWTNDEVIQDLDVTAVPELRHRFRQGHLGFESLSYPIRFRDLRIRELPATDRLQLLYGQPEDFEANWYISNGKPNPQLLGDVLHLDGQGFVATKEKFRDFALELFIRNARHHNSGIVIRRTGRGAGGRSYEIQLHDVEGAHYPTGSLYNLERSVYPRIEPEVWYPMQVIVKNRNLVVRVNGDTVLEYDRLDNVDEGSIELQAHSPGVWTEFKSIRVRRIL